MLYSDFPLYFDNTEIKPTKQSWQIGYVNIYNANMTEDGHDDIEVVRRGKVEISCSFQCSDRWTSIITQFNTNPMIDVRYYDVGTKDYITRTMYMDNLNVQEVQYSDRSAETNGLYSISFDLVEF